ncbi:MAG: class I mannose-6-phosphate isomerase [Clostridia bacterium]|nr:class I mannose-6-phosphate isomerase [Clostridia bacterium]
MNYPLILSHIYKERIWGGNRLASAEPPIGEDWVLSVRDGDNSVAVNGEFAGRTLAEIINCTGKFPLLIKFIDSKETLSIQVHPDDETAALMGGEGGKSEMWYIIDALPDSYIYLGMKDDVDAEEFRKVVLSGADPTPYLKKISVSAGECYYIPAGTPHAIGGGNYICEVQQNCDTTFRMYDYGRPRELHLCEAAKSLKKIDLPEPTKSGVLAECEYFKAELVEFECSTEVSAEKDGFVSLTLVSGEASISLNGQKHQLGDRDSVYIQAGEEKYLLEGNAKLIKTTV